MKTGIFAAATTCLAVFATSALAWEGRVVECYGKTWEPAEYSVMKVLETPERTEWQIRNNQKVKVFYPAVYREVRTMTKDGHWLMFKQACAAGN